MKMTKKEKREYIDLELLANSLPNCIDGLCQKDKEKFDILAEKKYQTKKGG